MNEKKTGHVTYEETPQGFEIKCAECGELLDRTPTRAVALNRASIYLEHFDTCPKKTAPAVP